MRLFPFFAPLCACALAAGEAPPVELRELPRFPAVEAQDAAATFRIKPGFHLELVAAEPLVESPIAVSFDENGRLFVCEMRDYPEQRDVQPHLGRIRLLEDRDGDGRFENTKVFADDLPWPTAVIWAKGGVFVCATPDIWWLQDTDGDGRADVREIVFTGFHSGSAKLNVQGLPNCFAWGPDQRIHLQTGGGNRGLIRSPKRPDLAPQEIAARDFWFDPRTFDFGFEAGGGQYGMSFDNAGRRFVCNNSDHLRTYLFDNRYAARNPFVPLPSPLVSVAADGPAAEVFRISPDEPWRVVRTRWRVAGKVPGLVEGGGRVSGYFTGATGTTVYRGDAYGPEFVGNTFTGDAGGNLVHRKVLRPDGVSVIGERPADESTSEFLASRDTWFRPVNFANAPDGTLFVVDMYREVIEHPWSIPEPIKQHLDLTNGQHRGRLWRIAPDGFTPRPAPKLGAATTGELVATLAHPNGWHRDTAARLLWERADAGTATQVEKMRRETHSPLARWHGLRVLDGLGAADPDALHDPDETVRETAVRLAEKQVREGQIADRFWTPLSELATDPAPRVRLQLAFTLGEIRHAGVVEVLARLAKRDAADPWISAAIRSGPHERMRPLAETLLADAEFTASAAGRDFLAPLITGLGARHDPSEITALFDRLAAHPALLVALGEGLARSGHALAEFDRADLLGPLHYEARRTITDAKAAEAARVEAARLLAFDPTSPAALLAALEPPPPDSLLQAIFASLDRVAGAAEALLEKWPAFDARERGEAIHFLAAKPARALLLFGAIGKQRVAANQIALVEAAQLRASRDPQVAALAATLLPAPVVESREAVIDRFSPALRLAGEAAKGHTTYQQRCATCHRFRGEGAAFGPDLESVAGGGREKLLTHLIDPNREVAPQFTAYVAELQDGTTLSGVLASESASAVILREPLGRETTLERSRLVRLQTTGQSPMPEGLEAGLQPQDLADLLTFLTTAP